MIHGTNGYADVAADQRAEGERSLILPFIFPVDESIDVGYLRQFNETCLAVCIEQQNVKHARILQFPMATW
jgi:hypothetical protein